jgi:hypothetical protein
MIEAVNTVANITFCIIKLGKQTNNTLLTQLSEARGHRNSQQKEIEPL